MSIAGSPLRALFWKEWRSARHLRWACIGLGVLLPIVFMAGAAMGRTGIAPFGRVSSWSVGDIVRGVIPGTFAFALWPFAALILTTQVFGGDRAAGTEAFLMERPVTRRQVWATRLVASVVSVATVIACTLAVWVFWVLATGGIGPAGWVATSSMFTLGGSILLAVIPCAALAASLLASPLLAIFASALLVGLPLIASAGLTWLFPYATVNWMFAGRGFWFPFPHYFREPIGGFVPLLLLPFYLVVSYLASTTGEPAGRGRAARGAGGLMLSIIVMLFVFVTSAQALLRREAAHPNPGGDLVVAPRGDRAILGGRDEGLWLVDTKTARVLAHYPRPSYQAVWNADGSRFAIETCAGALGSKGRCRVSVFDAEGNPAAAPWYEPTDEEAFHLNWGRGLLTVETAGGKDTAIVVLDPEKGQIGRMVMPGSFASWDYVGTLWDGSPAIVKLLAGETLYDPQNPGPAPVKDSRFGLFRFDPRTGTIDPHPLLVDRGSPWNVREAWISPSGRWYYSRTPKSEPQMMIDLETRRTVPATRGGWPDDPIRWYLQPEGDGTSLIEERQGSAPRTLRSWPHAWLDGFKPSPDRRYLLIRLWHAAEAPQPWQGANLEEWLYDSTDGSWKRLPLTTVEIEGRETGPFSNFRRSWAGVRTFAYYGPDTLAFEDLDAPGELRWVKAPQR